MSWVDEIGKNVITRTKRMDLLGKLNINANGDLLVEHLFAHGQLSPTEYEVINAGRTNLARAKELIETLSRRMTRELFKLFVNAIGDGEIKSNELLKMELIAAYTSQGGVWDDQRLNFVTNSHEETRDSDSQQENPTS